MTFDSRVARASDATDPYRLELRDFAGSILTGTQPRVGVDDAMAALRVALSAKRSQATGLAVVPSETS